MSFRPIYEGWDIPGRLSRSIRSTFAGLGLSRDQRIAIAYAGTVRRMLAKRGLDTRDGQIVFAENVAEIALRRLGADPEHRTLLVHLAHSVFSLASYEGWFAVPDVAAITELRRSELWAIEDQLKRVEAIVKELDETKHLAGLLIAALMEPVIEQQPALLTPPSTDAAHIRFDATLADQLQDVPVLVEHLMQVPFAPDFEPLVLLPRLRDRLEYNLAIASGAVPGDPASKITPKLPTKQSTIPEHKLMSAYLGETPLEKLFDLALPISLPNTTRFEHMHIVAGSGHGKTQTLQHLILHDLDVVAAGKASIVVMDSQSDLINTIASLSVFAPGGPLHDRLVLIDPTDIEWPVALNLFDVGLERLDQYSQLDRERLTNSILELYDFVLGSLLDAGMTQKQNVIFRYITRLLLHIPGATIHTLRELLEPGGAEKYDAHIAKLTGSARAFFTHEFDGKEFTATKRQVLRRLYGILENQTFERMFSHPKSKLDLFAEMNAGKVILINTAKDLLKESGTEIFGRFFIAMIAQAAQERAVLDRSKRLPTFVYIDEANDYFDRNIGIILSQARKYNVGMVLAHQFLGQLDTKLQEAFAANTAIKFAGGVSAKDARARANDLRSEASFIEKQPKLSFAAFIKGETKNAVSLSVEAGQMERQPRMDADERKAVLDVMREEYAVHYTQLPDIGATGADTVDADKTKADDDEPMVWE